MTNENKKWLKEALKDFIQNNEPSQQTKLMMSNLELRIEELKKAIHELKTDLIVNFNEYKILAEKEHKRIEDESKQQDIELKIIHYELKKSVDKNTNWRLVVTGGLIITNIILIPIAFIVLNTIIK